MESLKLNLKDVGKSKYLYNEIFTIKEYQTFRNSDLFEKYRELLKESGNVKEHLDNLPLSKMFWLTPISFCFIFFTPFEKLSFIIFIASIILGFILTNKTYKKLNKEKTILENKIESVSLNNPYTRYFYTYKEFVSYRMLYIKFKKLSRFLDKLSEYDDITVYKLEKELTYSTDNYNCYYTDLLFKDNKTDTYFTYAYSSTIKSYDDIEIIKLMTIFDIDIDTFEYKPRI